MKGVGMIFCSKNEKGTPAWQLVLDGSKTITRRTKPMEVGKEFAVCPGRGKKAVCRCRVVSCEDDEDWQDKNLPQQAESDAKREGFETWNGLWNWLAAHHEIGKVPLYRIEFVKIGVDG